MNRNIEKILESFPKLARLSTYLVFLLTPIVIFKNWMSPFITPKLLPFYIFSVLAFFFVTIYLIFHHEYRPTKKQLLPMLPIFFLVGSLGLSGLLAPIRNISFWSTTERGDGWFFLFHLLLLIFTVFVLIMKDHNGTYKKNILFITLLTSGIVALTVWFGNEGFNLSGDIFSKALGGGILGNSSFTATYLLFAVFLGLMVIFSRDKFSKGMRRFSLLVTILIASSPIFINFDFWRFAIPFKSIITSPQVLLGSGRGVAIGIILGIITALVFRMVYAQKKVFKIISIGLIVLGIIGYLFFFISIQKTGTPFQKVFIEQAGGNRLIFWNISRQAIQEKPVLGWGQENFRIPFHQNFDPVLARSGSSYEPWTDRAHNIFYDMTVAGGYVGLILFLLFIGSLIFGIYYSGKKGLLNTWSASFLFGGVCAYLFQGLFVFDTIFSYLMLGFLYAFIFGLIQRGTDAITPLEKKFNKNHLFYKVGISIIVVLGTFVSIIFIAISLARSASLYGRTISAPLPESTILWSRILDNPAMIRQRGVDLARLALYAENKYNKNRNEIFDPKNGEIRGFLSSEFQVISNALDKSVEFQKRYNNGFVMYMTLNAASSVYNSSILLSGQINEEQLKKAEYYSRESIKESPQNPQGYWVLSQTLILQKKISEADEMLEKAITVDPYNKQSHFKSIQLASIVGDKNQVTLRTERAKKYIPDFPEF